MKRRWRWRAMGVALGAVAVACVLDPRPEDPGSTSGDTASGNMGGSAGSEPPAFGSDAGIPTSGEGAGGMSSGGYGGAPPNATDGTPDGSDGRADAPAVERDSGTIDADTSAPDAADAR